MQLSVGERSGVLNTGCHRRTRRSGAGGSNFRNFFRSSAERAYAAGAEGRTRSTAEGDAVPSERFTGLAAVLDAIRSDDGITQPVLVDRVGLGRSVVAQRVAELEAAGLIESSGLGPSTGGRAPRMLGLRAEAGYVLGVDIATNELLVAVADLAGNLLETRHESTDVSDGPEAVFALVESMADALLDATGAGENLWSVGLGMPGPVAIDGNDTSMPTMPEWDRFPTRARLEERWSAPVWMENRVNLSALGERRVNPVAAASQQTIY